MIFFSVAASSVDKTTSPKAVVFWSDGLKLYMAYNENPTTTKVWTSKIVDENGGLKVMIPAKYEGTVSIRYAGMWYWRVAEVISLISFIIFILFAIKCNTKDADIK